ncbi:MAG: hypothetical protein HYT29_00400 [Parcubacteria group bacterium]|nr:hypothetical protein [Parcubacteria group bacterium]
MAAFWLFLPGWAFLILSLYFYFVPVFHPWKLFLPFLVFLFLAFASPMNFGFALMLAALFYMILGIKDLIFIDRRSVYEILVLILIFLLHIWFFANLGSLPGSVSLLSAFLLSAVSCLLYRESLSYGNNLWFTAGPSKNGTMTLWLVWLLISQVSLAALFLPLNFLYQSALAFFLSATLFGLLSLSANDVITRARVLLYFSASFVFLVTLLGLAPWGV